MSSLILHTAPAVVHTVLHSQTVPPAGCVLAIYNYRELAGRPTCSKTLMCVDIASKPEIIVKSVHCNVAGLKMSH